MNILSLIISRASAIMRIEINKKHCLKTSKWNWESMFEHHPVYTTHIHTHTHKQVYIMFYGKNSFA